MSKPIITMDETQTALEAANLLKKKNIKKLPIKNAGGKLSGIITQTDIVYNIDKLIN